MRVLILLITKIHQSLYLLLIKLIMITNILYEIAYYIRIHHGDNVNLSTLGYNLRASGGACPRAP